MNAAIGRERTGLRFSMCHPQPSFRFRSIRAVRAGVIGTCPAVTTAFTPPGLPLAAGLIPSSDQQGVA